MWVERKFWAPRLGLSSQVVHPGELLLSRPENMGTIEFSFGEESRPQRKIGGSWAPIKLPGEAIWERWLGYAGAGTAGQCSGMRVPQDLSPGRYRLVKSIERTLYGKPVFLAAPFTVSN